MNLEKTILTALITEKKSDFLVKVLPFIKNEYFNDSSEKEVFQEISQYIQTYNSAPTLDTLKIIFEGKTGIPETIFKEIENTLKDIETPSKYDVQWLLDKTEAWCQERALYNAMTESISIINNTNKTKKKGIIPQLLTDALSISFDPNIGHDYLEDAEERYEFYHRIEERLPFDLEFFNKITTGGIPKKSLSIIMAGIHVGKSLLMCHMSAACLSQGKNVLYITLEMPQEEIAKRIDANLFNIDLELLMQLSKEDYLKKVDKLRQKTHGKIIIKEYPTASASAIHFEALLNECLLKKNFIPDIIFIDYINICASSRFRATGENSYGYIKAVSEEIRGLAMKTNHRIVSATQVNREGFSSSEPDMTKVAESFGLPATADFLIVMIRNEEMDKLNQVKFVQLKNRFGDKSKNTRFMIGIKTQNFQLYDLENSAQEELVESNQNVKKEEKESKFSKLKFE